MLWLQRANIPGLLTVELFSKNFNLCDHNSPTSQTDGQTTCDRNTALCTKVPVSYTHLTLPTIYSV